MTLDWTCIEAEHLPASGPAVFSSGLEPNHIYLAYRAGFFPFPATTAEHAIMNEIQYRSSPGIVIADEDQPFSVAWHSPDPRPIVDLQRRRTGRSLRKLAKARSTWRSTLNRRFQEVVERCAGNRQSSWITPPLRESLVHLHREGIAHSVEIWDGPSLIGGSFGIQLGRVVSADSQFTESAGAGKLAVADFMARFQAAGGRYFDLQEESPHSRTMGATPWGRPEYLGMLKGESGGTVKLGDDARPVDHLAEAMPT